MSDEQSFYPLFVRPEGWAWANECCPHCGAPDGFVSLDEELLEIDDDKSLKITRYFSCVSCYEMWIQRLKAPVSIPTENEVELL